MAEENPRVGILIASDSDLETMERGIRVLEEMKIPYEVTICSAHRSPKKTRAYVESAADRGLRVIIAAAGRAAHLAGVVAAETDLPVIGVPIDSGPLDGLDSLLATVQMPAGIPVATMAIGKAGAENAALLAARILALEDSAIRDAVRSHRQALEDEIEAKNNKLRSSRKK